MLSIPHRANGRFARTVPLSERTSMLLKTQRTVAQSILPIPGQSPYSHALGMA
ncbi:hypothetical protein BJX70DRAFT_359877 [Aspergillus crustosus]